VVAARWPECSRPVERPKSSPRKARPFEYDHGY
jgi:hypothetical protein